MFSDRQTAERMLTNQFFENVLPQQPGTIAYMAKSMVMATLPHSKPEGNTFQRKNGQYTLTMIAHPKFGLPYGSIPRMLLVWLTTEAVRKKSPEIDLGKSLAAFLKQIGLRNGGGARGNATRVREQLMRLLTCSISSVYYDKKKHFCENEQFNISRSFKLWWNPLSNDANFAPNSKITLAGDFFDEITKRSIPIDFDAIKLLRASSLQMDIYIWLTYRFSFLKEEILISWHKLKEQFGSDYANDSQGTRNFKQKFNQALKKVWMIYPMAYAFPDKTGLKLYPSNTHVSKRKRTEFGPVNNGDN